MEVNNQNQGLQPKVQYNSTYNCGENVGFEANNQQPVQNSTNFNQPQYSYQYYQYPQQQLYPQNNTQAQSNGTAPGQSAVNIQIFNPAVTTPGSLPPSYNVNSPTYYPGYGPQINTSGQNGVQTTTQDTNQTQTTTQTTTQTENKDEAKTKKRTIVQLDDEYIKNLENYLNSPEKEVRMDAAKQVYERLKEDPERKNDKPLTALVNKMLQDPAEEIKLLAISALDGGIVNGDDFTVNLLKNMQNSPDTYGQNAIDASRILLKMSGKKVEKEFPIEQNEKLDNEKLQNKVNELQQELNNAKKTEQTTSNKE